MTVAFLKVFYSQDFMKTEKKMNNVLRLADCLEKMSTF